MKFDLHLRDSFKSKVQNLAGTMKSWQVESSLKPNEQNKIKKNLQTFRHTTSREDLAYAGVDGSGAFPILSYADSFIYLSTAQGTIYEANRLSGLKEQESLGEPLVDLTWLPNNKEISDEQLDQTLEVLAGESLQTVIEQSDYRDLKQVVVKQRMSQANLLKNLVRPAASDIGNLAIQLRTTAEFGATLRLLKTCPSLNYLLMDTTYSLPLISSRKTSLFFEHLKRRCCVEAQHKHIGLFTLSKSHGLSITESIEVTARELHDLKLGEVAEHWYLRFPLDIDDWSLSSTDGRTLPPIGAVSYLVRFHRSTPVMRLDMDRKYWEMHVLSEEPAKTIQNEKKIFEDLDYACHDQRTYGYPYPIKAAHDRASLTNAERLSLKKQIIAGAIKEGMNPKLFRDPSQATGHR